MAEDLLRIIIIIIIIIVINNNYYSNVSVPYFVISLAKKKQTETEVQASHC